MDQILRFLVQASSIFFAAWSTVVLALGVFAFGPDLVPPVVHWRHPDASRSHQRGKRPPEYRNLPF